MSSTEPKVFWYSVEADGAPYPVTFSYDNTGVLPDGGLFDGFKVTPFGEGGSMLEIDYDVPIGIYGASWNVFLAFRTAIDFTEPLPLDQFSPSDSYYEFHPPDVPEPPGAPEPPGPSRYAVQAVTAMPPPAKDTASAQA